MLNQMAGNIDTFSSVEGMPIHLTDRGRRLGYQVRRRQQRKKSCIDFKYAIPLVVVLLSLKYQGKPQTPFDTNPILITISVIAMLVSFIAASTKLLRLSVETKRIIRHTRDLSGALALALLGSFLFSHSLFWSAYLVCLSPLLRFLFHLFKYLLPQLPQTTAIQYIISKLHHLFTKHTPELPTPPV